MDTTSRIEISKSALENNYAFLQKLVGPDVMISTVAKGNAYGHGINVFVPLAEQCGARHFSVFDVGEAYQVKKASQQADVQVMIMGMLDNQDQLEWVIENHIEYFVFDLERLRRSVLVAKKLQRKAHIHIELETGMNRTGFREEELPEVARILKQEQQWLSFEGLCTHFAGAESIGNYVRVKNQRKQYKRLQTWIEKQGLKPKMRHTACSAAAVRYPPTRMDMVRTGILLYGFWPSRETFIEYSSQLEDKTDPLRRLISWKTRIMDIKHVQQGEYIGYGTSYLANDPMKLAIIPVGYAHGFARSLSNQGRVLINGKRVAVVGTVNMNAISVDITQVEGVERGDEVVIIGRQGEMVLSVDSFSEYSFQVNYELLSRLPINIPRIVVD
jgi:alanine racemase